MARVVLTVVALMFINISIAQVQAQDSCAKDCGCGQTIQIAHRSCPGSSYDCACHVTLCNDHFQYGAFCWSESDTIWDYCHSTADECNCENVWNHMCAYC